MRAWRPGATFGVRTNPKRRTMHVEPKPRGDRGLTRLVRACAEHPWRTLGLWLTTIVVIVTASAAFGGKLVNESSIPGSDSQQAVDLLKLKFPERAGDSARIVFSSDSVLTNADGKKAVAAAQAAVAKVPGVIAVGDPYAQKGGALSKDGRIGFL